MRRLAAPMVVALLALNAAVAGPLFPGQVLTTASGPRSVAIGDFNGDGNPDLATANQNSGDVTVFLGSANGTFGSATSFPAGVQPSSVATGDLNGDGKTDLAVANENSDDVSILLGDGVGTFAAATSFPAGNRPRSIAIGDLNADGIPDLAVANLSSGNVSILLGVGDGTFATATSFLAGNAPYSVAIGDLNGDGNLDLAVANGGTPIGFVSILLGAGDGTFGVATSFPVGNRPRSVAIGDLNGDGNPDLAVANRFSDDVSVLLGAGDGTFAAATSFLAGNRPVSVAIGDLNGDGNLDLALANENSDDASVLFGAGDGTFATELRFPAGDLPQSVVIGDFDGDGTSSDLAVANLFGGNVSILLGAGDGTFVSQMRFAASNQPFSQPISVAINDLNFDNNPDLVVANSFTNDVSVLLGAGDGTFAAATSFPTGNGPISVAIGELNGDGILDLAVANGIGGGGVSIMFGVGDGTTFTAPTNFLAGNGPRSIAISDLNGDGNLDLVLPGSDLFSNNVAVHLGVGDGTFAAPTLFPTPSNGDSRSVAIGDLNSDGNLDLAVANGNSSFISVFLGAGDGTFAPQLLIPTFFFHTFVAIGDLDGDGNLDLAMINSTFFDVDNITILLGVGDGTFSAATRFTARNGPTSIAIGELDNDGNLDLAVATGSGVSILLGAGDGTFGTETSFTAGDGPRSVAIGSLNGDLFRDIVVANNFNGDVSVLLNQSAAVGPIPADFDGNGVVNSADLATLLVNWGPCPQTGVCIADLDGNNVVNPIDLALLLVNWTP